MMKVPYVVAVIQKDAVEHLPVVVPMHEVAVLSKLHGEDKVVIDENADLPTGLEEFEFEPDDEYARLEERYGLHPETKMTYAQMTYGSARMFEDGVEDYVNQVHGEAAPVRKAPKGKPAAKKTSTEI